MGRREDSGDGLEGRGRADAGTWRGEDALVPSDGGGRRRPWQLRGHPRVKRGSVGGEFGRTSCGRIRGCLADDTQLVFL